MKGECLARKTEQAGRYALGSAACFFDNESPGLSAVIKRTDTSGKHSADKNGLDDCCQTERLSAVCLQSLLYALLAMADVHLYSELLVQMFGKMLCRIHAAVLSARASEREHQVCETALHVAAHMSVGKFIDTFEERYYLAVVLKEAYDGLIESGEFLVGFVASGIVCGAAVEHIASSIARVVGGNAFAIAETEHTDDERTLAVVLRECRRTVLRMCRIDIVGSRAVAVGTAQCRLFDVRIFGHIGKAAQHIHHVGVREAVGILQQFAQVVHRRRYGFEEMLLALEVATEPVGSEHLQSAEEYEQTQTADELTHGRHLGIVFQRIVVFGDEVAA